MAFIHSPKIVTDGLVLALDAGNTKSYTSGSTTWFDKSGFGNNGTLTNGPTFSSANGGSLNFTRTNNTRATIPTLNLSTTNVITVDFWINLKSLPTVTGYTGDYARVICELSDNFNLVNDSFIILVEYELTGFRWNTGAKSNSTGIYNIKNLITPLPVINTWYNMSIIFDHAQLASNQRTFYINGILQTDIGTTAGGGISYNAQNTNNFGNRVFRIGGRGINVLSQDMLLSSFKIYNRALTPSEVLQNYNATKGRFGL